MYAIVKTGGKQYRVQEGESLLVERLAVDDGATVQLQPLLYVDGSDVVDGENIAKVTVEARVLAHERGPKLRVVKFKPKRGYKRHNGHRQELTRVQITSLKLASGQSASRRAAASSAKAGSESASTPPPAAPESTTATVEATDGP
jgi:large subunit ribosomal protein L21